MKTTFLRRGIVLVGALTLTVGVAAAQQGRAPADPRTVPELKPEFDRAAQLALPEAPLVTKAREGYLKEASPKGIRDGLRDVINRMVTARAALAPVQGDAELMAGADALKQGATPTVLRNLRAAQRHRSIEVGLGVLTELVARRVPLQEAAAHVATLLSRGATDKQILTMAGEVSDDITSGLLAPSRALDVRSQGVLSLLPGPAQGTAATQPVRR